MFGFATHTHTHLGGECPHRCSYCYVGNGPYGRLPKYQGPVRIVAKELRANFGEGKTIFAEHCNDLFAAPVPDEWIRQVLAHCCQFPKNRYLFHTKNPDRYRDYLSVLPPNRILGMTAETNRPTPEISLAPPPMDRLAAFSTIAGPKLVTVEPILQFDLEPFVTGILQANPDYAIVGADSKGSGLAEPSKAEVLALLAALTAAKVVVHQKWNLRRLL